MMVHNISSRKSDKHLYHSQAPHTLLHRQTCSHIQTCRCHRRKFFIQQTAVMKKMTIGLCREQEITEYSVLTGMHITSLPPETRETPQWRRKELFRKKHKESHQCWKMLDTGKRNHYDLLVRK